MKSEGKNAWLTEIFVERMNALSRRNLRDLYPSEAWSLYRVLPECDSVLDIGCGSDSMLHAVRKIAPRISYVGIDMNSHLIEAARQNCDLEPNAVFHAMSSDKYFADQDVTHDCVMAWAFLYTMKDYRQQLDAMIKCAKKYVLFDMRIVPLENDVADVDAAYTFYGDERCPYVLAGFTGFISFLREYADELSVIEIAGYDFPPSRHCWVRDDIPQPSIISVVLKKRLPGENDKELDIFLRLPPKYSM